MTLIGKPTKRRSNAKNAYDLMSDIKEYILEEPKRVFMGDWLITDMGDIEDILETTGPACGTVGCIAGNAVMLTDADREKDTCRTALNLLGGDNKILRNQLQYRLFLDTEVHARYGTKKYARIVAQRIVKFQQEHEQALREVAVKQPQRRTRDE